jgi:hypothetical protein
MICDGVVLPPPRNNNTLCEFKNLDKVFDGDGKLLGKSERMAVLCSAVSFRVWNAGLEGLYLRHAYRLHIGVWRI